MGFCSSFLCLSCFDIICLFSSSLQNRQIARRNNSLIANSSNTFSRFLLQRANCFDTNSISQRASTAQLRCRHERLIKEIERQLPAFAIVCVQILHFSVTQNCSMSLQYVLANSLPK